MADEEPEIQEAFLIAPGVGNCKPQDGVQELRVSGLILQLIATLPPKTPGVAAIKKGAIALAQAGVAKLDKTK